MHRPSPAPAVGAVAMTAREAEVAGGQGCSKAYPEAGAAAAAAAGDPNWTGAAPGSGSAAEWEAGSAAAEAVVTAQTGSARSAQPPKEAAAEYSNCEMKAAAALRHPPVGPGTVAFRTRQPALRPRRLPPRPRRPAAPPRRRRRLHHRARHEAEAVGVRRDRRRRAAAALTPPGARLPQRAGATAELHRQRRR